MPFLQNAWYVAAWDEELGATPLARTLLDEPVVLYRDEDGGPVALHDMCPHRFAPLSLGKVLGDRLQCPYHGLVYDKTGVCVHNPNGRGVTPSSLSVRSYPLRVRNGIIWIWFGDAGKAGEVDPPEYSFLDGEGWRPVQGYLHIKANYELVTDNLLDLSHAEFLHPFLSAPGEFTRIVYRAEQDGDRVSAFHNMPGAGVTGLFRPFCDEGVTRIDGRAHMHWEAPANMMLDVGCVVLDSAQAGEAIDLPGTHLLTPETEGTTHYFWSMSRNRQVNDTQLDEMMKAGVSNAFEQEDEPMIRAVFARMGGKPLFELSPALLPQDEAAVRARRVLARRVAAETAATA